MRLPPVRVLAAWLAGIVPLLLALAALQRPAPLFLNLGAGDGPFARGFRGGWERDGLRQSGETMFRWTQDGSRLEWPVVVRSGDVQARLRLARFVAGPADVTVSSAGRVVDHWTQAPRGWTVRVLPLGPLQGPVSLQFRSISPDPDQLGLALDWVEVQGARRVFPAPPVAWRLALLCLGLPALLAFAGRTRDAWIACAALSVLGVGAITADRFGGLMALSSAAIPVVLVTLGLVVLARLARERGRTVPVLAPALFALIALVALAHPFYYYPDVDTHARFLAACRESPSLLLDPTPYQLRTGAWTREIAGRRVAFPYSPAFHVLAWPLALPLGEVAAIKTLAVASVAASLVLVRALALEAGLAPRVAALVPPLFAILPVITSRLTLALYPALLGQALELGLLLHLARGGGRLRRLGDGGPTLLLLVAALVAYTGSLINVSLLLLALAALLLWAREPHVSLRLLLLHTTAVMLVLATLYARFVPTLLADVLPQAAPGADGRVLEGSPLGRLALFYDTAYPLLLAPGLLVLRPGPARRALAAALGAGLALLFLRYAFPVLFRDAKDVELLAAPMVVTAAAALGWCWAHRHRALRVVGGLALAWLFVWSVQRALALYAERFLAVGR